MELRFLVWGWAKTHVQLHSTKKPDIKYVWFNPFEPDIFYVWFDPFLSGKHPVCKTYLSDIKNVWSDIFYVWFDFWKFWVAVSCLGSRWRFLASAMGIAIANHKNRCDFGALNSFALICALLRPTAFRAAAFGNFRGLVQWGPRGWKSLCSFFGKLRCFRPWSPAPALPDPSAGGHKESFCHEVGAADSQSRHHSAVTASEAARFCATPSACFNRLRVGVVKTVLLADSHFAWVTPAIFVIFVDFRGPRSKIPCFCG